MEPDRALWHWEKGPLRSREGHAAEGGGTSTRPVATGLGVLFTAAGPSPELPGSRTAEQSRHLKGKEEHTHPTLMSTGTQLTTSSMTQRITESLLAPGQRCCQGNARHTPGSPWTGKLIQHCMLQRTAAVWTDYFQEKGRLAVLLLLLPLTQPGHIGPYLKHHSSALLQQVEQKGKYPLLQSLQSKSVFFFFLITVCRTSRLVYNLVM